MVNRITIPYFPKELKFVTPLFIGGGIYLGAIGYIAWGVVITLMTIVVLTTRYVTEIDLEKKGWRDYLWFLGFYLNVNARKFDQIDRIVITKGNYAQTVNTRVQSRTMKWSDYTGTIVFDDNNTLPLITRTDKRELVDGLRPFATFLGVRIEDRTTRDFFWIN